MTHAKCELLGVEHTMSGEKCYIWGITEGTFIYRGTMATAGSTFMYPAAAFWRGDLAKG